MSRQMWVLPFERLAGAGWSEWFTLQARPQRGMLVHKLTVTASAEDWWVEELRTECGGEVLRSCPAFLFSGVAFGIVGSSFALQQGELVSLRVCSPARPDPPHWSLWRSKRRRVVRHGLWHRALRPRWLGLARPLPFGAALVGELKPARGAA